MLAEKRALGDGRQGIRSHIRSTHRGSLPRTSTRSDPNTTHPLGDGTRVPSPSAKLALHAGRLKLLLPRSSSSQNQVSYFSVKTREGEKRFRLFTMLREFFGQPKKTESTWKSSLQSAFYLLFFFFFLPCPRNRKNTFAQPATQKRSQQRIYFFQPGLDNTMV